MGSRRKSMFGGFGCAAIALVAPVLLGGCGLVPQVNTGTGSAQFVVSDQSGRRFTAAENGAALQFPATSALDVKVNGSAGAQQMNVLVSATIPACGTEPVPGRYATKQVVYQQSPEQAANTLVQDWALSGWTLKLLNVCHDPASPWFPAADTPAGSFLLRAQVQDANGNWSESDLTIEIAGQ
jgi:hypothetical protein